MIDKITNNPISDILSDVSARPSKDLQSSADNKADALLQVSYESLIEKARQEPTEDTKAVERARQLMLSGQLDSPENIRKAAGNILRFGI